MLSHVAPLFYAFEKSFRMLRRRFTPLKNAFACCAAVFHPCKVLSHAAPPFYTLAKCFRTLRRHFACQYGLFFQGTIDFQLENPVLQINIPIFRTSIN